MKRIFLQRSVAVELPAAHCSPKFQKEYILYAPLTKLQKDIYDLTVKGSLRKYLIQQGLKGEDLPEKPVEAKGEKAITRSIKGQKRKGKYQEDSEDDDDYFTRLADGLNDAGDKDATLMAKEHQLKQASTFSPLLTHRKLIPFFTSEKGE